MNLGNGRKTDSNSVLTLYRGPKNGALVNRAFVPPKRGGFDENGENDEFAF